IFGVGVEQVGGDGGLDYMPHDVGAQGLIIDRVGVLGGDHYRIYAPRFVVGAVFNCHLGFAVGPEVRKHSIFADFSEAKSELVGQIDRRGHVVFGLIGGVAEHHALVAGAAGVHTHGDIARLLVDAGNHRAGVGIKTVERVVITDGLHDAAHDFLEIDIGFGRN